MTPSASLLVPPGDNSPLTPSSYTQGPQARLTHTGTPGSESHTQAHQAQSHTHSDPRLTLTHNGLCPSSWWPSYSHHNPPTPSMLGQGRALTSGAPHRRLPHLHLCAPSVPGCLCPYLSPVYLRLFSRQAVYHRGLTRAEVLTERGCGVDTRCPFFSLIEKTEVIAQGAPAGISP